MTSAHEDVEKTIYRKFELQTKLGKGVSLPAGVDVFGLQAKSQDRKSWLVWDGRPTAWFGEL